MEMPPGITTIVGWRALSGEEIAKQNLTDAQGQLGRSPPWRHLGRGSHGPTSERCARSIWRGRYDDSQSLRPATGQRVLVADGLRSYPCFPLGSGGVPGLVVRTDDVNAGRPPGSTIHREADAHIEAWGLTHVPFRRGRQSHPVAWALVDPVSKILHEVDWRRKLIRCTGND
jgi:hypothetical protein